MLALEHRLGISTFAVQTWLPLGPVSASLPSFQDATLTPGCLLPLCLLLLGLLPPDASPKVQYLPRLFPHVPLQISVLCL